MKSVILPWIVRLSAYLLIGVLAACATQRHPGLPSGCTPSEVAATVADPNLPEEAKEEYLKRCGISKTND